ncbi:MAG: hypothetical protein JNJ44_04985 [Zoogloeaceae bacterium]|nr:hypothetical protein [Zoogloeaceae bacterium]
MAKAIGRAWAAAAGLAMAMGVSGVQAQSSLCPAPTKGLFSLGFAVEVDAPNIYSCDTASFKTLDSLYNGLKTYPLSGVSSYYSGTEVAYLDIYFNGLPVLIQYPNFGATGQGALLVFEIPALGVSKTFLGADRDESQRLLEDYLKSAGLFGRIMKYQAAHSPNSPISGPGGLIPTAVASDFADVFDTLPSTSGGEPQNNFGIGLNFSNLRVGGLQTRVTTLPLSYTIRNNIDPRRQLAFSMPISLSDTEGAKSYHINPGVSYRVPMTDAWSVSAAARVGIVGSMDIGSLAGVVSGSVASTYAIRGSGFDVAIGNMVGYYATTKVSSGDYSANPEIRNVVLRNGVMLSQPVRIGGMPLSAEYSVIDTRYLGTEIYVDNTQEIGVTVGTNRSAFSSRSFLRGGLSYLRGRDTHGVSVNIGYWF